MYKYTAILCNELAVQLDEFKSIYLTLKLPGADGQACKQSCFLYQVDNNVTRHINQELQRDDWDIMILHYLGLDHIGHIAGPASPLVGPKLHEMDQVLKDIYSHILRSDHQRDVSSLLVLCGDHGMSDVGSHGGSSLAETSTPLVFMSPLFERHGGEAFSGKQVQQIDLAPTLSLLLGLPIPQNR